jgi:Ca2+-binding RTX toxin-like protein
LFEGIGVPKLYISPLGSGLRDGSSSANAGTLSDLPAFVAAAGPGGEVLLLADKGAYTNSGALSIVTGGTDGHPVAIRGINSDGNPAMAEIVGHRVDPYVPNASSGEEVFRLLDGADHLVFSEIEFKNISYAAIRVGADIEGLTIEHVRADNVQRFLENFVSGGNETATISGLTVRDVQVNGFSKGVIRLQYDSHDVVIEDVVGDSERQNGENFAIGIHFGDTVHDVRVERVSMRNAFDNVSGAYWQGDGFASEKDVYDVRYIDTVATGNTDAGYDLKSSSTTLTRAVAEGNGRNFRIWGQDVVIEDAVSLNPQLQGGIANQQHFGFMRGAKVTVINPYLSDASAATTAFDATEGLATVEVFGASLHLNVSAPMVRSAGGSVVTFTGSDAGIGVRGAGIADFSGEARGVFAYGDGAAQTLIGSEYDDVLQGLGSNDHLVGGDGADRLDGGAGNDVLEGGAGGDLLIGGAGFDFADYHLSDAGISVDLAGGAPTGGAESDLLEGIEGLIGSAFDDHLHGDGTANILRGGDGDDVLDGRGGDDMIVGGSGADRIIGGDGIDTVDYSGSVGGVVVNLSGGPGSGADAEGDIISGVEVVIGSAFADLLTGSEGDDFLIGGAGADQFVGGVGVDTVDFGSNGVAIAIDLASGLAGGGDAEGDSFSGIEIIRGTAFDDIMTGDNAGNVFHGGAGADRLDGAGGDDLLIGGAGADALIGGSGSDTVDYTANATAVIVDLLAGTAQGGDADGDTLNTIENLLGTAFADSITGDTSDNRLDGGAGDDWIRGGVGADLLIGGAGVDTADYGNATAGVVFDATGAGMGGDAAGDRLQSIEIVVGSQFGDVLAAGVGVLALYGAAGNDTLNGSAGDDLLVGGAGSDSLSGGAGIDTADYSDSASAVLIDLGANLGSGGDAEGDSFRGIERLVGSQFVDSLRGDESDNILIGGSGADSLFGGGGFDTIDYSISGSAVVVDLLAGVGSGGDAHGDVFAQIDAVIGSAFADNLTGDNGDNRLVGGAGADRIVGGAGRDLADYGTSAVAVRIDLSTGLGTGGDATGDTLYGIEDVTGSAEDDTLTGDAGANVLSGGAGNDIIDGGAGDDLMIGGAGDDRYTVDSLSDVVVEDLGNGSDRINTTLSSYVLGSNLETLIYTGTDSFTGYGNELTNSFVGSVGSETFFGLDGDDRFFGSAGADTFYGGAGANSADYSKSKTSITINLHTNVNRKGDAEGDVLYDVKFVSGSDAGDDITGSHSGETLYGRGGNDLLYGLDGDDTLDGGAGADRMEGGNGNDTYVVDVIGDQVIEAAGGGKDLVRTTLATYTLGDNLDGLAHTGTRAFTGVGNALDNEMFGGAAGDTLIGGDGNDILMGRGGADLLDGGEGSDTATYANSTTGVTASLLIGMGYAGEAQGDRYASIENLLGSSRDDQLTGDDQANRLDGGAGADRLHGGDGDDTIVGGAGNDLIDAGAGMDTVEFSGAIQDYGFAMEDGAVVVTDLRVGAPDGIDTVNYAEFFRFNGDTLSRDAVVAMIDTFPPNDITLSDSFIAENAAPGVIVGTVVGSDATPDEKLTYSLAGNANGRFVIDTQTGILSIASGAVFDYETEPSVSVVVVVHDAGGLHLARSFDLTIGNVNEAPDALALTGSAILENAGGGVIV